MEIRYDTYPHDHERLSDLNIKIPDDILYIEEAMHTAYERKRKDDNNR